MQYLCSSRVDPTYGQVLDICDLVNPYTYGENRTTIARAELEWEFGPPYLGCYAFGARERSLRSGTRYFFASPDGSEVWCAYHGMKQHNENVKPQTRYFNIQKIDFDETGYPIIGVPVGCETELTPPSGEEV